MPINLRQSCSTPGSMAEPSGRQEVVQMEQSVHSPRWVMLYAVTLLASSTGPVYWERWTLR